MKVIFKTMCLYKFIHMNTQKTWHFSYWISRRQFSAVPESNHKVTQEASRRTQAPLSVLHKTFTRMTSVPLVIFLTWLWLISHTRYFCGANDPAVVVQKWYCCISSCNLLAEHQHWTKQRVPPYFLFLSNSICCKLQFLSTRCQTMLPIQDLTVYMLILLHGKNNWLIHFSIHQFTILWVFHLISSCTCKWKHIFH